jgi:anaerobic magnesium-protoporphyrin IX monomethyl ester cyclase
MKVQLIFVPPENPPKLGELGEQISPPLGILYLAGYLRQKMPQVQINVFDGVRHGYQKTLEQIENFDADIVGLSYYTPVAASALRLADRIKREHPSKIVILGGPHATALPQEGILRSAADLVVYGEGEATLVEIVSLLQQQGSFGKVDWEKVDGLCLRKEGKPFLTPPRKFIANLDDIPFPARDLLNLKDYTGFYLYKYTPETNIIMSRGCPYRCTFCSNCVWNTSTPRVRIRSAKNIADEIEHLYRTFGVREAFDNADEFNNNLDNAMAICAEIKSRKLPVAWKTQLRAYPLPEELVKAMVEAGCWYVHLGIESGNPEALKGIKKNISLEQVEAACRLLKKYRVKIHGLFMLFNVWEEEGQLRFEDVAMTQKTLDFAKKLVDEKLLDYIGWSITTPYPGSPLYDIATRHKLVPPDLLTDWDAWLKDTSFLMNLPGVSHKQMADMKAKGSVLRARLMLRSGGIGLKDAGYFVKKLGKILQNVFKTWMGDHEQ